MESSFSAAEHFRDGLAELRGDRSTEALEHLRTAHRLEPSNAEYRSYYGLSLGLSERRFDKALELCRSAAKEEFFNPDLYCNLALVHLSFGFKAEAIRYLRRGLMIDPQSPSILAEMKRLGVRRRPVLGFLRRGHIFNRWLGAFSPRDVSRAAQRSTARA